MDVASLKPFLQEKLCYLAGANTFIRSNLISELFCKPCSLLKLIVIFCKVVSCLFWFRKFFIFEFAQLEVVIEVYTINTFIYMYSLECFNFLENSSYSSIETPSKLCVVVFWFFGVSLGLVWTWVHLTEKWIFQYLEFCVLFMVLLAKSDAVHLMVSAVLSLTGFRK